MKVIHEPFSQLSSFTFNFYLTSIKYGENLLKQKKTFSSPNGVDWVQLPDITTTTESPTRDLCRNLRGRLMGDLSHEYYVDVIVPGPPSMASHLNPSFHSSLPSLLPRLPLLTPI
jgi:hypothetical protein